MTRRILKIWSCLLLVLMNLPILAVVLISFCPSRYLSFPPSSLSFAWYRALFSDPSWREAALNSLLVATGATLIAAPLTVIAALGLARSRWFGRNMLDGLAKLPLVVPTIVPAVALYIFFSHLGFINKTIGLMLAHAAVISPIILISTSTVLETINQDLQRAAQSLGATRITAFRYVMWPLLRPGILSGMLFAFLMSFDELTVSLFLTDQSSQTLPVKMWNAMRDEFSPVIAAASSIILLLSILILVLSQLLPSKGVADP